MPRKPLIRSSLYPYHITTRSNNKEWFYLPSEDVWVFCQKLIHEGSKKFNVKVDAFVLMNNHYHMLVSTPEANIDSFMQFFNKSLSLSISRSASRINRIFGSSYKWTLIESESYYLNVIRYIYQNPIRANIVKVVERYPYSDYNQQDQHHKHQEWINTYCGSYETKQTQKNLKKFIL